MIFWEGGGKRIKMAAKRYISPIPLSKSEKKIWKTVIDGLLEIGDLSTLDLPLIAAYCKEWGIYAECMEVIEDKGSVIKMVNGKQEMEIISPYYKNANTALQNAKNMSDRFGLNSLARKKMKVTQEKEEPDVLDDI